MKVLKNLSRKQIISIAMMLVLIVTSLWVWEKYDNYIEDQIQTEEYDKLQEENELLNEEVRNLTKQNHFLHEVIGLKRQLE